MTQDAEKEKRLCERCGRSAVSGIKFCNNCKYTVLGELYESGYLETGGYGGHKGQGRTREMKEIQYETRNGMSYG